MKSNLKFKIVLLVTMFLLIFGIFLYTLNKIIMPTVMAASSAIMRTKVNEIVYKTVLDEYTDKFNYDDMIKIYKDNDGNISMIRADTVKLSSIALNVSLKAQNKLKEMEYIGIKIPTSYIFKNNIIAYLGPKVTIRMEPLGSIETKYISSFDSAGINQTRHRINVEVVSKIRVILPFDNNDIEVKSEIPISETIIVGKIPQTSIDLDLNESGYKN